MSDPLEDPTLPTDNPDKWSAIGEGIWAGIAKHVTSDDITDAIVNAVLKVIVATCKATAKITIPIAKIAGGALAEAEEPILPIFAAFMTPIVAKMFGSDVDAAMFNSRENSAAREDGARALVDAFMSKLAGDNAGEVEPGDEGARRIATAGVHAAIEGWFNAWILEMLGECVPWDWLHFTEMTKLPEDVISALGVGRLVRRAITPLVNATATTPLTWATNKQYRPKLLAESTALRQFLRGNWDWSDVEEELARQGYTSERMDALLNELGKFFTPGELSELVQSDYWSADEALQHLRNAGYDADHAFDAMRLEGKRIIKTQNASIVTDAIAAYVRGAIDAGGFDAVLSAIAEPPQRAALAKELAATKRQLATKFLSSTDVKAAVKAQILSVADYRAALTREGFDDDAVTVLDLLLRYEMDASRSIAQHKVDADQAKKDAAAKKAADAAAKKAEIDAARQLKAQGSIAEIEHAAVIGLIPLSRLEQILAPQFTPDTVSIYVADVEAKRQAYLDQQQKKADAATRAANKGLPAATLELAVYDGVISIDAFAAAMDAKDLDAADVAILVATVKAKKADLDAAKQKRAAADLRASQKHIDLSRAEQLVRLGIWTDAQYAALVASLGFDDAAVAAMVELLDATNAGAAAGTATRKAILARDPTSGLTLDQFRTAVKLGDKTLDQFMTFLVNAHYTADQQSVLVDELRSDLAVAELARLRRGQGDTGAAPVPLNLSTATKAAELGIITPAAYQQRLIAGGYSADDVAIEMELLTAAIAKAAGAKKTPAGGGGPVTAHGLTLTQVAAAVKVGAATPEDYRSAAIASGLDAGAVHTLMAQLADTLATITAAKGRRATIESDLLAAGVSLTELEDQVRAGGLTVIAFEDRLTTLGYSAADAQLVGALLEDELAAVGA